MLQKVYCNVLNSIYFLAFAILIKFSIVLLQIVKLIPLWNIMSFISASLDSFKRKRCVLQSHRPRQELQFHCLYGKKIWFLEVVPRRVGTKENSANWTDYSYFKRPTVNFCNSLWKNRKYTKNLYPGSGLPEDNNPTSCLFVYFVVLSIW